MGHVRNVSHPASQWFNVDGPFVFSAANVRFFADRARNRAGIGGKPEEKCPSPAQYGSAFRGERPRRSLSVSFPMLCATNVTCTAMFATMFAKLETAVIFYLLVTCKDLFFVFFAVFFFVGNVGRVLSLVTCRSFSNLQFRRLLTKRNRARLVSANKACN